MVLRPFHVDALFAFAGVDAPDGHRLGLSTAEWSAGRLLLSASGRLFPSAFSASLIAIVCFFVVVLSLTYALLAGVARSMADVFELLVCGIRQCAPLFVIYILFIQFYESLRFVFW